MAGLSTGPLRRGRKQCHQDSPGEGDVDGPVRQRRQEVGRRPVASCFQRRRHQPREVRLAVARHRVPPPADPRAREAQAPPTALPRTIRSSAAIADTGQRSLPLTAAPTADPPATRAAHPSTTCGGSEAAGSESAVRRPAASAAPANHAPGRDLGRGARVLDSPPEHGVERPRLGQLAGAEGGLPRGGAPAGLRLWNAVQVHLLHEVVVRQLLVPAPRHSQSLNPACNPAGDRNTCTCMCCGWWSGSCRCLHTSYPMPALTPSPAQPYRSTPWLRRRTRSRLHPSTATVCLNRRSCTTYHGHRQAIYSHRLL
jgi:hypothetical protein